MNKNRLEAFSDGVIAIIITIMVLELKVPHGTELADLQPLLPTFLSYMLSFIYVGIYWNNHHHLLHAAEKINGPIMWANLFLLFCLSLIPFVSAWMGENHFSTWPIALYGVALLACAISYTILVKLLTSYHGKDSKIARAIGPDTKGNVSLALYLAAIVAAFWYPAIAISLYCVVAIMWLIPDRRIERVLDHT